jgi:hypothetical protein
MELFLVDGEWKWSGIAAWDVTKGPLVNVSVIAERFTDTVVDIGDKLDFDTLPQVELRDRWLGLGCRVGGETESRYRWQGLGFRV